MADRQIKTEINEGRKKRRKRERVIDRQADRISEERNISKN